MILTHLTSTLSTHFAAVADACNNNGFFGFPHWYKYLDVRQLTINGEKTCQVVDFSIPGDLTLVALAILDMLLRLAGMVAVGFVVYGSIQYVTSQGEPDGVKKAQNTIVNALIGVVIALVAAATVSFIGRQLVG